MIVKVEHAHMLEEAAKDNDLVRVWVLPAGAHGILEAIDSALDLRRLPRLLRALGDATPSARPSRPGAGAELVYSASETG